MSAAPRGFLFIVSSPSGGGKTTLIRRLLERPPGGEPLRFSVSHTTRPRREGEVDGREYHFVSAAQFETMARRSEFLEHNEVHGNFYGTSKSEVLPRLAAGEDVVLDIDVQGAPGHPRGGPGSASRSSSFRLRPGSSSGDCGTGASTAKTRSENG